MAKGRIDIPRGADPMEYIEQIREYKGEDDRLPSPLQRLLYEEASHRCSICKEPYMEIHHIKYQKNGGKTEYDNLIVLCPNCHTRVHQEKGDLTANDLHRYKKRLMAGRRWPVFDKISREEWEQIKDWIDKAPEHTLSVKPMTFQVEATEFEDAVKKAFKKSGLVHLKECGILHLQVIACVKGEDADRNLLDSERKVYIWVQLTDFGGRWIGYLSKDKGELKRLRKAIEGRTD